MCFQLLCKMGSVPVGDLLKSMFCEGIFLKQNMFAFGKDWQTIAISLPEWLFVPGQQASGGFFHDGMGKIFLPAPANFQHAWKQARFTDQGFFGFFCILGPFFSPTIHHLGAKTVLIPNFLCFHKRSPASLLKTPLSKYICICRRTGRF